MFRGTALFICDVQKRVLPQIFNRPQMIMNIQRVVKGNRAYRAQIAEKKTSTPRPARRNHFLARRERIAGAGTGAGPSAGPTRPPPLPSMLPNLKSHLVSLDQRPLPNTWEKTEGRIVVAEFLRERLGETDNLITEALPLDRVYWQQKDRYTMFDTELDQALKRWGVNHILLTGVQTEWCVTQTALDYADRGYQVEVLEDATGSQSEYEHLSALERLKKQGIWVTTTHGWLTDRISRAENPITQWYLKALRRDKNLELEAGKLL